MTKAPPLNPEFFRALVREGEREMERRYQVNETGQLPREPAEHEHSLTDEIVCPHCGHEHSDSREMGDDSDECEETMECHECEKSFTWHREIFVMYTTSKDTSK